MKPSAIAGIAVLLIGGLVGLYFLVIKESPGDKPAADPVTSGSAAGTAGPTGIGPALPTGSGTPKLPQGHNSTRTDRDTTGLAMKARREHFKDMVIANGSSLDDGDIESFLDRSLDVDVDFGVKFHDQVVIVPRGGGAANVEIRVTPK